MTEIAKESSFATLAQSASSSLLLVYSSRMQESYGQRPEFSVDILGKAIARILEFI